MYFVDTEHKERFMEFLSGTEREQAITITDRNYVTACYLLTASKTVWEKSKYFVTTNSRIYFCDIFATDLLTLPAFSKNEKNIVKLARELFSFGYSDNFSLADMADDVDEKFFKCCISAIKYFRYGTLCSHAERKALKKAASVGERE